MAIDLPAKLRVTAAALGCVTRKELCARFRAINPATHFDLERSHKWMQGKAEPRAASVYEDWARLLGSERPVAWLTSCDLSDFIEAVAEQVGADSATLRRAAGIDTPHTGAPSPTDAARRQGIGQERGQATGRYACYSLAWSPYFNGQVIRGGLVLEAGRKRETHAIYSEQFGTGLLHFHGAVQRGPRTMYSLLASGENACPLFLCLYLPGESASALGGVIAGGALLAQEQRPTAGRFAAIRVPDGAPLDTSHRYLPPSPGPVAADLAALGLPAAACPGIEAAVLGFILAAPIQQISVAEQASLAEAVDRAYLGVPD